MTDKNVKIVSCLLILLLGLLIGCIATGEALKADPGQKFTLRIGQTAEIKNEPLAIRFNGVTGDSRCPKGVTCVWAGEVKCDATVTHQGASSNITFTQMGSTEPSSETYKGYKFTFSVQPYPEAGKQIAPADYRLVLTVEKNPP